MASSSKKGFLTGKDMPGGFKPKDTLAQSSNKTRPQAPTEPGPNLAKFLHGQRKIPSLVSHTQKRPSEEACLDQPPRKRQLHRGARVGTPDILEDLGTEQTRFPEPHGRRTRLAGKAHREHARPDPFHHSKSKKPQESIVSSDTEDEDPVAAISKPLTSEPSVLCSSTRLTGTMPGSSRTPDIQKTTFTCTKDGMKFKISRASCHNSTYDASKEDEQKRIYLGVKDSRLLPYTRQGFDVSKFEWLEVKPSTMMRMDFCPDFSPVLIKRSSGAKFGPILNLEFASSNDHRTFIAWVRERVATLDIGVRYHGKDVETMNKTFERAYSASRGREGTAGHIEITEQQKQQPPSQTVTNASPTENEKKLKPKLSSRMRAKETTANTGPAVIALDEEPEPSVSRRSSRRTNASSDKPGEPSSNNSSPRIDDGSSPNGLKKTNRGSAAISRLHAKRRWIDLHPNWSDIWDDQPLIYPFTGRNTAQITKEDVPRLEHNDLLNDNLIVFYSRYLQLSLEKESPSVFRRTYIFNPWFYSKLSSAKKRGIDYDAVKSWTAKVDLFAHDFIVVPVNEHMHWYLAIICYPGKLLPQKNDEDEDVMMIDSPPDVAPEPQQPAAPTSSSATEQQDDEDVVMIESDIAVKQTPRPVRASTTSDQRPVKASSTFNSKDPRVITFDSLGGAHSPTCTNLRDYLVQEAKHKRGVDITVPTRFGLTAKGIPEQNDFNSCGAYLLGYLEKFFQHPDLSVEQIVLKKGLNWEIEPGNVRDNIREAITQARIEQNLRRRKEKESKEAKKQARAKARLANGNVTAIPSSPLPEPSPVGTNTSTEPQQTAENDESDRLSRGNAPAALVPSQASKGNPTEVGPFTTGSPPGLSPRIPSQLASEFSCRAEPTTDLENLTGVAPEHASGATPRTFIEASATCAATATEVSHGISPKASPNNHTEAIYVIADLPTGRPPGDCTSDVEGTVEILEEVIRRAPPDLHGDPVQNPPDFFGQQNLQQPVPQTGCLDNGTTIAIPDELLAPLRSTPTCEVPSSPLAAHLPMKPRVKTPPPVSRLPSSPGLEVYTESLSGSSGETFKATQVICLESDDRNRVWNDDSQEVSDGYCTAPETIPDQSPSNILHTEVQQKKRQGKHGTRNKPIEVLDNAPKPDLVPDVRGRTVSSYFAPIDNMVKPNNKRAIVVGKQGTVAVPANCHNPFIHQRVTTESRVGLSEDEALMTEVKTPNDMTVDLTNEED